jgi:hypothetical protein
LNTLRQQVPTTSHPRLHFARTLKQLAKVATACEKVCREGSFPNAQAILEFYGFFAGPIQQIAPKVRLLF